LSFFSTFNTGANAFNCFAIAQSTLTGVIAKVGSAGNHSISLVSAQSGNGHLRACLLEGGNRGVRLDVANATMINCTALNTTTGFETTVSNTGGIKNCVAFNCTTDYSGTWSGTNSNNASEDGTHPGTSGVTITSDPFEADGHTPTSAGQLAGAGVFDATLTEDAVNNSYANPPAIGAFAVIAVAGGDLLLTNRSIANYQGIRQ